MAVHRGVSSGGIKVRSLDVSDFAPRSNFRRRNIGPTFSFVLRDVNQSVVGASPDFSGAHGRWRDGVDHAAAFVFRSVFCGNGIKIRRDAGIFAREVRADLLPRAAAISGAKQNLRTEIEDVRIDRRKNQRKCPGVTKLSGLHQRGRHQLNLFVAEVLASYSAAEGYAGVRGIRGDVAAFAAGVERPPIMKIQGSIIAAAWRGRGVAILLRGVNPVGKSVVDGDVVKLAGGLVEPGAPCFAGVAGDDCALVATHNHAQRLIGIDPQSVIIVAAGRAFPGVESGSAVGGLVRRGVRHINRVGIFWIDAEFTEVPAALPDAAVVRDTLPVLRAVVGTVQTTVFGVDDQKNALRIAGRDGDADAAETFGRESVAGERFPVIAAVARTVEAATRAVRRWVDAPGRTAGLPERSVNCLRVAGFEGQVAGAGVFILI